MTQQTSITELGSKPVGSLLMQYAVPAIIATAASSLYSIIDSIFIGQGVGPLAISGLALTMPLMSLTAAFGAMVGVGASTLLSVKLGERDYKTAQNILGNVLVLNIIMGIALGVILLWMLDPVLYFFGASRETIPYARDFMQVILAGNVITHLYLGLNAMLRAAGKPRMAMGATIFTVLINIILAPIFIYLFKWGIRGAATATVTAQTIVLMWQFYLLTRPDEFIRFRRGTFRLRRHIVQDSLSIGMSPFLINLCASMVVIVVNRSMVQYGGDLAVGAYGIVNRLALLFVMIVIGLNQGMQPIAGYNFGARNYDRLIQVLKYAIWAATAVMTIGFIVGMFFPFACARAFTTDAELIEKAGRGMRLIVICYPIIGMQIVTTSFFQSIGHAGKSIFLSLTRQLIFLIPLLIFLPTLWGIRGVWLSMPIADALSAILTFILLIKQIHKFKKQKLHTN